MQEWRKCRGIAHAHLQTSQHYSDRTGRNLPRWQSEIGWNHATGNGIHMRIHKGSYQLWCQHWTPTHQNSAVSTDLSRRCLCIWVQAYLHCQPGWLDSKHYDACVYHLSQLYCYMLRLQLKCTSWQMNSCSSSKLNFWLDTISTKAGFAPVASGASSLRLPSCLLPKPSSIWSKSMMCGSSKFAPFQRSLSRHLQCLLVFPTCLQWMPLPSPSLASLFPKKDPYQQQHHAFSMDGIER